jgi:endoglucanase
LLGFVLGSLGMACSSAKQTLPGQMTGGASGSGGTAASGGTVGSGGSGGGSGAGGSDAGGSGAGGSSAGGSSAGGSSAGGSSAGGATGTADAADDSAAVDVDANTSGTHDVGLADVRSAAPEAAGTIDGGSNGQGLTGFLHIKGNQLFDSQENLVRLTGVNWFGFETGNEAPHGTWARDYKSMLKQIHDLGFNTVRLPWSNAILRSGAAAQSVNTTGTDPYDGTNPMNGDLVGKTPMQMLDLVVTAAGQVGLKLILDNHSRDPDKYLEEALWYTTSTSQAQWIADWVTMATRYAGNPAVVGMDLDNEPHGKSTDRPPGASWGTGNSATDWNTAAETCGNAILQVNPDVLIVVEGVEEVGTDVYWSGGNLTGVNTAPIKLSNPQKLLYSAHEYGPEVFNQTWFSAADFPSNLASIWNAHFDFIMKKKLGHVLIGEFGIRDRTDNSGEEGQWFDTLLTSLGSSYSWTFWCWNPDSGDTGGLLSDDWLTPVQWKMDALKPYQAPALAK